LDFFDKAQAPEHKDLLCNLPGIYETLLEVNKDGAYFISLYAIMEPSAHLVNTSKAPYSSASPELSHRAVYKDPKRVAQKLGLIQAVVRYMSVPVLASLQNA
jgi:hypothetical protein